MPHKAEY